MTTATMTAPRCASEAATAPFSGNVNLARASLIYDWRRYLAAILAVAFSGLLVIVQLGLLGGIFGTVTAVLDHARADLWVIDTQTESFDLARPMPASIEMRIRAHPEVATVQSMIFAGGDWRRPDGGKASVFIIGLDVTARTLSMPASFHPDLGDKLRMPGAVVVDEVDRQKLGVSVGDLVEINGRRAQVVGTTTGMRAIGGANVFTSKATAEILAPESMQSEGAAYYLVKLRDPARAETTREALEAEGAAAGFKVLRAEEFSSKSQLYWLFESGAGAGFAFSTSLGLLVGIAITTQTLRAAILAALREYATLRALGVSIRALRGVVVEQAFWIGLAGLSVAAMLTALIYFIAQWGDVAIRLPLWSMLFASLFTLGVSLVSGLLAINPLYKSEPAELLR